MNTMVSLRILFMKMERKMNNLVPLFYYKCNKNSKTVLIVILVYELIDICSFEMLKKSVKLIIRPI